MTVKQLRIILEDVADNVNIECGYVNYATHRTPTYTRIIKSARYTMGPYNRIVLIEGHTTIGVLEAQWLEDKP